MRILFPAILTVFLITINSLQSNAQRQILKLKNQEFELHNVTGDVVKFQGKKVLKIERDLEALPFDGNNLIGTVDEPTYLRVKDLNIKNGVVEVKVLSKIQPTTPFQASQGFIGIAFRVNEENSAYESIYLRPRVGRSENQMARNHTVQYYAYPDFKFDTLRHEQYQGRYETYADVDLDEWITLRIEFQDKTCKLFINEQKAPAFIVTEMLGKSESGTIGLWVDIGTEGYFKDLKITKK